MRSREQEETVAFLKRPETHSAKEAVEVVETHAALVFLVGKDAFKIKRAVKYDYLDYSTLAQRHDALCRELELNAPSAPTIYRDIIAVTHESEGQLALGGAGDPVEWVLRMNRFPTENELIHVAERGELDARLADALGYSVARYHATAPIRSKSTGSYLIAQILAELRREFADMGELLPTADIEAFHHLADAMLKRLKQFLDTRTDEGHVRRCHGDLHLRNIVLVDGAPVLFDALEFDEQLGTCDVLYDLAFLLMDLQHRGMHFAANRVLNQYLFDAATDDHFSGLAALPLFLAVRAAISAMVAVQMARVSGAVDGHNVDGRRYLADAISFLHSRQCSVVAVGGLSGSGKSTLARCLAPDLGAAPGAVHLRSDLIRKALFGVDPLSKLSHNAYTQEVSKRVYERLCELTDLALHAGHSVIADAAFVTVADRAMIERVAKELAVPFAGLWLEAGPDVLLARVGGRSHDASDADATVVRHQLEQDAGAITWTRIDAGGTTKETLARARLAL